MPHSLTTAFRSERQVFAARTPDDLLYLAEAIEQRRLTVPFTEAAAAKIGLSDAALIVQDLRSLSALAFEPSQIVVFLRALANERRNRTPLKQELVVTGPDVRGRVRDTSVVVEQLFEEAKTSVLMVWYALYGGHEIFKTLASKLDADPRMRVRLCLDISRAPGDDSADDDIAARFAERFIKYDWPSHRLPEILYYPQSLVKNKDEKAVLHAKCIVIDSKKALVTSANPTPAAYHRNIELGVVFENSDIPRQIEGYFTSLIDAGFLRRLRGTNGT